MLGLDPRWWTKVHISLGPRQARLRGERTTPGAASPRKQLALLCMQAHPTVSHSTFLLSSKPEVQMLY